MRRCLYYGDGYVTVWFMCYLSGDDEVGGAFFGAGAEITANTYRQDVAVNP